MPEIINEYPEGLKSTEMCLVRMLKEKRCWNDIRDITEALWRVQFTAKKMKQEQEHLSDDSNSESKP